MFPRRPRRSPAAGGARLWGRGIPLAARTGILADSSSSARRFHFTPAALPRGRGFHNARRRRHLEPPWPAPRWRRAGSGSGAAIFLATFRRGSRIYERSVRRQGPRRPHRGGSEATPGGTARLAGPASRRPLDLQDEPIREGVSPMTRIAKIALVLMTASLLINPALAVDPPEDLGYGVLGIYTEPAATPEDQTYLEGIPPGTIHTVYFVLYHANLTSYNLGGFEFSWRVEPAEMTPNVVGMEWGIGEDLALNFGDEFNLLV